MTSIHYYFGSDHYLTIPITLLVQDFYTHQGEWMHTFKGSLPPAITAQQLAKNSKNLTIDDVEEWVVRGDGIKGRFRFFETFARTNEFYLKVAKPLLSLRTTGSIDVERRIKPIKDTRYHDQETQQASRSEGGCFFRASENLKHIIMRAKKALGKRILDSLI